MNVFPIHNDEDLARAMVEVERLWGSPLDSKDGQALDILATLIDVYERIHYPFPEPACSIAPGCILTREDKACVLSCTHCSHELAETIFHDTWSPEEKRDENPNSNPELET